MKVLFVGGGNMATAIIGGLITRGVDASTLSVVELSADSRQALQSKYGVAVFSSVSESPVSAVDLIVLAVKPQQLRAVAIDLAPRLTDGLVLSIAAGVRLNDLSRWLGGYRRVVRSMPNTPAMIQCGVTGLYAPAEVDAEARAAVETVVAAIGTSFWVNDEALMDAVTAVSGSGPAYVFYFMEALQQGALEFGFSPASARQMALETVLGAAKLAAAGHDGFDVLRQRVTSKGGTTEAALNEMKDLHVAESIVAGMRAAEARGAELGQSLGKES